MNETKYIARTVCDKLSSGSPLVLISVISVQGSAPRRSGTKMAIGAHGKSYGTIGGSLLEAAAVSEARAVLSQGHSRLMHFDFTGDGAYSSGMICGGKAMLLLDFVPVTPENVELFRCWYEAILNGHDGCLLTLFKNKGDVVEIIGRSLFFPDGRVAGYYPSAGDMETLKPELHNIATTTVLPLKDMTVVIDPIHKIKTLYCFGAGHVAVPTARLAAMVGFRVVVVDDRAEFANAEHFPEADDIIVIEDFSRAMEGLRIDGDSFVIILTREHRYDRIILAQALRTDAGYIGMISSRKKRDTIYTALMAEGVTREELESVHSPIGLSIGAETPEEIAVSIVGELISEWSQQKT